jgi:hypothetical protein
VLAVLNQIQAETQKLSDSAFKAFSATYGTNAAPIQMPSAPDQMDRAEQLRAARERKLQEQMQTQGGF